MNDIITIRKGQTIKLTDDYVLGVLDCSLILNYPTNVLDNNLIVGDGKSTCKELIRLKAKGDLPDIEMQLKDLIEAANKLKEIIGE